MNKYQAAKEVSIEIWTYLRDHPDIVTKRELPRSLWLKIEPMMNNCPLCEVFAKPKGQKACEDGCPMKSCMEGSAFDIWKWSTEDYQRKRGVEMILKALEEWNPSEK